MLMTKIKIATAILLTVVVAGTSMRAVAQASVVGPLAANGVRSGSAPRSTGAADPVSEGNPKLKTRGPSPASAEDLPAICRKMGVIKDRLKRASGGKQTQKLQKEVVVRLDEMIHELENREKKTPKMEDVLAELKLIRAMQNRINVRTAAWSNQYKGEQVPPPETIKDPKERQQFETIRQELKELAARQEKVATVTDALAKAKD